MRQAFAVDGAGFAQAAFVWLATLAALALLGAVLAYWSWAWLAPAREARTPSLEQRAAQLAPARRLFGGETRDAAPSGLAIELLGVAAESGGAPGYAVLRVEAKRIVAAREGDELEPGVRLLAVRPDHVVLERAGARETLSFPRKKK